MKPELLCYIATMAAMAGIAALCNWLGEKYRRLREPMWTLGTLSSFVFAIMAVFIVAAPVIVLFGTELS